MSPSVGPLAVVRPHALSWSDHRGGRMDATTGGTGAARLADRARAHRVRPARRPPRTGRPAPARARARRHPRRRPLERARGAARPRGDGPHPHRHRLGPDLRRHHHRHPAGRHVGAAAAAGRRAAASRSTTSSRTRLVLESRRRRGARRRRRSRRPTRAHAVLDAMDAARPDRRRSSSRSTPSCTSRFAEASGNVVIAAMMAGLRTAIESYVQAGAERHRGLGRRGRRASAASTARSSTPSTRATPRAPAPSSTTTSPATTPTAGLARPSR